MVEVKPLSNNKAKSDGFSISEGKKSFSIHSENQLIILSATNEYGNSITLRLDKAGYDDLFSTLWQFVKDRQH